MRRQVPVAMTNHVLLAGSVLAGVALWVGVYTALLPQHVPASSDQDAGGSQVVAVAASDHESRAPRRWVDFPRDVPQPTADPAATEENAAVTPDLGHIRHDRRPGRLRQTRRAGLATALTPRRLTRERTYGPRQARSRLRRRRLPEPIQFSLATRSSS
jgi:hypothetical protein